MRAGYKVESVNGDERMALRRQLHPEQKHRE